MNLQRKWSRKVKQKFREVQVREVQVPDGTKSSAEVRLLRPLRLRLRLLLRLPPSLLALSPESLGESTAHFHRCRSLRALASTRVLSRVIGHISREGREHEHARDVSHQRQVH